MSSGANREFWGPGPRGNLWAPFEIFHKQICKNVNFHVNFFFILGTYRVWEKPVF